MTDTTDIEKKSLEAHVELCAERYRALELQLENVKQDVVDVKTFVQETHVMVHDMATKRNDQIIAWGAGVIGILVAALGWLLVTYVFK